ncbi:SIR2 family protein [Actinosynnema sp. NPDC047251]|uniref:Helicase n=1 Tax=Saccharothrix espanaensis (strain ATCC 51144 / DSM 44229 / JCM 9112 / NBRC 15066 / NRRL 15764) TaxID=1179773 RepID=K0JYR6_SACES|nr:SIR2 family protein [Saccharothrix espanaensis]CCH29383.1 hypothetical protein BN6_20620 [Saccharothrix espanaensis DSM 44229]
MSNKTFIKQLKRDSETNKIALILGAGVSSAATKGALVATWQGLLLDGLEFLADIDSDPGPAKIFHTALSTATDADALVAVAQWVRSRFNRVPGEFSDWLNRTVGDLEIKDTTLLSTLPNVERIVTTNYDILVERHLGRQSLNWTDDNASNEYRRNPKPYVFHAHGLYKDPRSIILSGEDYGRLEEDNGVHRMLTDLASSYSLLFIGFGQGFEDPNFRRLVNWLRNEQGTSPYRHYLLLLDSERTSVDFYRNLSGRITPIFYGADHSNLPNFLADLTRSNTRPADELLSVVAEPPAEQKLTYAQLLPSEMALIIGDVERELGAALQLSPFQLSALKLCRSAVVDGKSGLLSAVTGTGKTTIARIAVNMAVALGKSGIELLPTKALVAQERSEWDRWIDAWTTNSHKKMRVYGSSRDYPENDRPVSRGRYEVALAIYEKLGVYLVSGRTPLANTRIAVVDELQMLVENSQRAAKLEAILTSIRLMPEALRPAILGLSATLPADATESLRRWLGVNEDMIAMSNQRPIPLDTYVMDAIGWKVQPDAHLFNIPGQAPPPPSDYRKHDLNGRLQQNRETLSGKIPHLATGELAATLIDHVLEKDENRRIICFVPSRTSALELASAVHALLKNRTGAPTKGSPWSHGRFATEQTAENSEERYNALRYSDLPQADVVVRGLREGVAAHSASFPAPLRRLLEDEFRREDGLLRVLIATDTLAVGVNLPADTVIATSISGYTGTPRRRHLLTPSDLDNKAGRAGRRGKTQRSRGEFYLIASAFDLENIEGLSAPDLQTLSTVEGIYNEFVATDTRTSKIASCYRTTPELSSLVLHILCQDGFAREESAWLRRVEEILSCVLLAHEKDAPALPSAQEVLDELVTRKLVVKRHNGKLTLSGIGVALARSSLDLDAANTLERLARLVSANAGDIDLLWNTCRSQSIQTTTDWVSLPPVATKHYPSLKEAVIRLGNAYCAESELLRRDAARRCGANNYPVREALVERGSSVVSTELRELLLSDGETASDSDVTALLRALVSYEWSRGLPFGEIKARFSTVVKSEESQPGEAPITIKIHYSDVEQLCEQIAGVISSAAEICVAMDGLDYSGRAMRLGQEVETGLPAWLAPIAKMRIPALHRERLAFLWDAKPPADSIVEVLERPEFVEHPGIRRSDLQSAAQTISLREQEDQTFRNRIAQRWAATFIPGGEGEVFEDISDRLDAAQDAKDYLGVLCDLANSLRVDVGLIEREKQFVSVLWQAGQRIARIYVPSGPLTQAGVEWVGKRKGMVILSTRMVPGAITASDQPTQARFVQPEHLLSMLARLIDTRETGLHPEEVVDGVSRIMVSSFSSESWYLYEPDSVGAPPPFPGDELPSLERAVAVPSADDSMLD